MAGRTRSSASLDDEYQQDLESINERITKLESRSDASQKELRSKIDENHSKVMRVLEILMERNHVEGEENNGAEIGRAHV